MKSFAPGFCGRLILVLFVFGLFITGPSFAQDVMTNQSKQQALADLIRVLKANYPFREKVDGLSKKLAVRLQSNAYDRDLSKAAFASLLSKDLVDISGDLHFSVGYDPAWIAAKRKENAPDQKVLNNVRDLAEMQGNNFGFEEVSVLAGNIGYVRFSYFADPEFAYETATAAMKSVAYTHALIFDLRNNRGGYLEMAQFLASYLFPHDKDQLLFQYYYFEDGTRIERGQWLLPALPGRRMPDVPVYVLTSNTSFSSAEWFAYSLQKLGRATIVGERTAGGAHPVDRKIINDDFFVQTPIGEIRDPVDHGDFEGKGVSPDYPVSARKALSAAHGLALDQLVKLGRITAEDREWLQPFIEQKTSPSLSLQHDDPVIGRYEGREVFVLDGEAFMKFGGRFTVGLIPLSLGLFGVDGIQDFRYRVVLKDGKVRGLERIFQNGSTQFYEKLEN